MDNFKQILINLLRRDVADKALAPAISFIILTVTFFPVALSYLRYGLLIQLTTVLILVLSIDRVLLIRSYRKSVDLDERTWNHLRLSIFMTLICWSVLFAFVALEVKFSGTSFIILSIILSCFVTASLTTFSSDLRIFSATQLLFLVPQVGIITYDYFTENQYQLGAIIPIYVIFYIYQMIQVKDVRRQTIERFKSQYELKKKNTELQEIQEAQILQTIKLIHTSRLVALGEMAAGIAHEVNNPLAIISGNIQQLERKIMKNENSEVEVLKGHTQSSHLAIERITKIITGLRLFSQQSDSLPKVSVSLGSIVNETLNFCGELLKARYVKLVVETIPEALVNCHPVQVSQVMINLIKNAEDALEGEIIEEQRWIKISFQLSGDTIEMILSNGGPTIPIDVRPNLFTPFFTTKGVGKGTGLGLSISKGIMVEHGGDLIFNEEKAVTTFTVILPRAQIETVS